MIIFSAARRQSKMFIFSDARRQSKMFIYPPQFKRFSKFFKISEGIECLPQTLIFLSL